MSKLPTGGYQPTNRPENLTLPNKGPSYKPKAEKIKTIWHPYPQEKPQNNSAKPYLVSVRFFDEIVVDMDYYEGDYFKWCKYRKDERVIAWAEMPDPYKEEKNV